MSTGTKKLDTLEKRQELLIGGRLRDKEKILAAIKKQEAIRKRLSSKPSRITTTEIIRKFRDSR